MGLVASRDQNVIEVSAEILQAKEEVDKATKELLTKLFNDRTLNSILDHYEATGTWRNVSEALERHRLEVLEEYKKLSVDSLDQARIANYSVNNLLKPEMVDDMMDIRRSLAAFRYNQLVLAMNCTQVVGAAFAMAALWDSKYQQAHKDAEKFLGDINSFMQSEWKPHDTYVKVYELIDTFERKVLQDVEDTSDPASGLMYPDIDMDHINEMERIYEEHQKKNERERADRIQISSTMRT